MSIPVSLGSATRWAQMLIDLARYQTQHFCYVLNLNTFGSSKILDPTPWVQLVRPNILGFNYVLNLNTYGFNKIPNPTLLGSATRWVQVLMGLVRCQIQHLWVQLHTESKYVSMTRCQNQYGWVQLHIEPKYI
jgi:hypothetical protein